MSHSWLLWRQLDAQVLDESVLLERFLLEVAPLQFLTCRWVFFTGKAHGTRTSKRCLARRIILCLRGVTWTRKPGDECIWCFGFICDLLSSNEKRKAA